MTHEIVKEKKEARIKLFKSDTDLRLWDRQDTERAALYGKEFVDIHFLDGSTISARLLEHGQFGMVVELVSGGKKKTAYIYKNALKMLVFRD